MRIYGTTKSCLTAVWPTLRLFLIIMLAIMLVGLIFTYMFAPSIVNSYRMEDGSVVYQEEMTVYADGPSGVNVAFFTPYTIFMFVLAIVGARRNVKYLVSLSATRTESVIGSFFALIAVAAMLALGEYAIGVVSRGLSWISGMRTRGAWSVSALLLDSGRNALPHAGETFGFALGYAGLGFLIGSLSARWPRSVLIAVLLVFGTVLVMARLVDVVQYWDAIYALLMKVGDAFMYMYIDSLAGNAHWYDMAMRQFALFAGCMVIAFPVVRWQPVR